MKTLEVSATGERRIVQTPDICDAPVVADPRIEQLRQAYRDSTMALCQLAGRDPVSKLEDVDFVSVRQAALVASLVDGVAACDTISYCLFQLYRLDGGDAWDRI